MAVRITTEQERKARFLREREVSRDEYFALFEPEVHAALEKQVKQPGVDALVCFENVTLDSSRLGDRTSMIVGPDCTYGLADIDPTKHLYDLPSMRQYPRHYYLVRAGALAEALAAIHSGKWEPRAPART